ncbi:MAG: family 65 glycosyl hydrolase domain-containing protein [Flavobacteriales bacterium]
MIKYLQVDPWKIIEEDFNPKHHQSSESIFSIGNGSFGQRANFEESYSGKSLQGSYVAGIYYPDKTRVGWWKNGYPEYFAKVLNSVNWIGLQVKVGGLELDLAKCEVTHFHRELDMKTGLLKRSFTALMKNGICVTVNATRFCSMAYTEVGVVSYSLSTDQSAEIEITPYLDANVRNEDSNYDESFWKQDSHEVTAEFGQVTSSTLKTKYQVSATMRCNVTFGAEQLLPEFADEVSGKVSQTFKVSATANEELEVIKFVGLCSTLNHEKDALREASQNAASRAQELGINQLTSDHEAKWTHVWENGDIEINGDEEAQQAIRFNIFQLNQTYTGDDARLNIGPKGFTGEKYGGSTYWDTEAYCLPFYLNTRPTGVARQLLVYRYKHLKKAIENAEKLGFKNGAALYPMVTMNGEECHNEWEITFEEIHRNGAIAFAIYNYIRYTGDKKYLAEFGWDVLLGISRFWSQRGNYSSDKEKWVMLGVTGPNEYENNVNNNWYTNYIAAWTMRYTAECVEYLKHEFPNEYTLKVKKYNFLESEISQWKERYENMHYPMHKDGVVRLQQDGFLDKEQLAASELEDAERPINQHWSWDRILRSIFIKQADTLQGFYVFEDDFSLEEHKANFDFYEPKTVHESSLSPCVHCILAAKLGYEEKAYEMYLRTSRLDLDDYNHEAHEGLHITSMGGTYMAVVEGFAGLRVKDRQLHFNTMIPQQWESFSFKILFRDRLLKVSISKAGTELELIHGEAMTVSLNGELSEVS